MDAQVITSAHAHNQIAAEGSIRRRKKTERSTRVIQKNGGKRQSSISIKVFDKNKYK